MNWLFKSLWKFSVVHANFMLITSSSYWSQTAQVIQVRSLYLQLLVHLVRQFFFLLTSARLQTHMTPRAQALLPKLRQGGLFLTAHLGYWEWMGSYLRTQGVPLVATYLPPHNPVAHSILKFLRARWNNSALDLSMSPMQLRELFQKRKLFTLLADQNYRSKSFHSPHRNSSSVMLLDQPTDLNPLVPWIQKVFPQAPTFAGRIIRTDQGTFELDLVELQQGYDAYIQWLQSEICTHPTQWAGWTHRIYYSRNPTIYT